MLHRPRSDDPNGAAARPRRYHFHRSAAIPGPFDEALFLQVRQVLVYGGQRREAEATADFLEARRIAVLADEFVQVVENLALTFCERKHVVLARLKPSRSAAFVPQAKVIYAKGRRRSILLRFHDKSRV